MQAFIQSVVAKAGIEVCSEVHKLTRQLAIECLQMSVYECQPLCWERLRDSFFVTLLFSAVSDTRMWDHVLKHAELTRGAKATAARKT